MSQPLTKAPPTETSESRAPGENQPQAQARDDSAGTKVQVAEAVRLGWYLAEVRGRCWWKGQRPSTQALPADPDFALPLRPQRTLAESRQQAVDALVCLAEVLDVATPLTAAHAPIVSFPSRLSAALITFAADEGAPLPGVESDRLGDGSQQRVWQQVAELIYEWDASIQDQLTARDDLLACGYLLGRGLAEIYWALAPLDEQPADNTATHAGSWPFLLHPVRRHELSRMVGRIAPYLSPLTSVAVSGSLEAWGCVADDSRWRGRDDAPAALYEQLRVWYQLLVIGQDPTTLFKPSTMLHGKRAAIRVFRAFWVQLVIGAVSVGAVAAFALLVSTDSGNPLLKSLLAIAGTIGLSASTLAAKAKSASQSLLARLRQNAYSDLVAIVVTNVPPHPDDGRDPKTDRKSAAHRKVEYAVTARTVAAPTDAPVRAH